MTADLVGVVTFAAIYAAAIALLLFDAYWRTLKKLDRYRAKYSFDATLEGESKNKKLREKQILRSKFGFDIRAVNNKYAEEKKKGDNIQ